MESALALAPKGEHTMLRSGGRGSDCGLLPAPMVHQTLVKPLMTQPLPSEPLPFLEGSVVSSDAESSIADDVEAFPLREPLRFSFVGYTVWLHLEQHESDLNRAIQTAAERDGLLPIPSPHVTVVYGMTHLTENEAREKFNVEVGERVKRWPKLRTKGILFDRSFDGVDGENMDMAWVEITLATSSEHECMVDIVHDIFHDSEGEHSNDSALPPRNRPWTPHISLAYDNPDEDSPLSLGAAFRLASEFPSLLEKTERDVTAISLWKTEGKMEEWTQLERIELR